MKRLWKIIKETLKEAYKNAFSSAPFHIVGKDIDNLTKQATFFIKAKRMPTISKLTTKEITHDGHYLYGLSSCDRKQIEEQYLLEIKQPQAYIEEYPITLNENNQYIFKILLLEKGNIVCGSASHFINDNKQILSILSQQDIVKISMAYYMERFGENEPNNLIDKTNLIGKIKTNVHYLKCVL